VKSLGIVNRPTSLQLGIGGRVLKGFEENTLTVGAERIEQIAEEPAMERDFRALYTKKPDQIVTWRPLALALNTLSPDILPATLNSCEGDLCTLPLAPPLLRAKRTSASSRDGLANAAD
jgi:hypothetical protein